MKAYLIGICGTAMANLALMLKHKGWEVKGSDRFNYPPMGPLLARHDVPVCPGWDAKNIQETRDVDLVVVGNVARRDNPEVLAALSRGWLLRSMPQVLEEHFLKDRTVLVVTGTHGKTTVASLTSWILERAGVDPSFLVGGIPLGFGSGFKLGNGPFFVIEGDEYDTAYFDKDAKFFHYRPTHAVMTSLEFDHADIYRDLAHLEDTFTRFAGLIPRKGNLAWCREYPILDHIVGRCQGTVWTYGFDPDSTVWASHVHAGPSGTSFRLHGPSGPAAAKLPMWGRHNVLNALAAASLAYMAEVPVADVVAGLASFPGVRRRQQVLGDVRQVTVVDDFAHHPTAVRETVRACRARFPERRLVAVYHFESNTSRRKVFETEYGEAFHGADVVWLTHPLRKDDGLAEDLLLVPQRVRDAVSLYVSEVEIFSDFADMAHHAESFLRPGDVLLGMSGRDLSPLYTLLGL